MMLSSIAFSILAALVLPLCRGDHGGHHFPAIRDYHPQHDLSLLSALGSDLKAIDLLLLAETEDAFLQAQDIYIHGGYSAPHAVLHMPDGGLPFNMEDETELSGTTKSGKPTTVTVIGGPYKEGDSPIKVEHRQSNPVCRRTGLPNPNDSACLVEDGILTQAGHAKTISYKYSTEGGIHSDHTLRNLSVNAKSKFKVHGNNHVPYYKDFQKYVDYFGVPDFGDKIVTAAFEGTVAEFPKQNLKFDFSILTMRARRSIILHTCAHLIVGLFVIREMEAGITHCDHRCGSSNCNSDSIHALDGAVNLYTGDVYKETGKGNFLYGLAQHMCAEFRTCGKNADRTDGEAKINSDIFAEFNAMQKYFDASQCLDAKKSKELVAQKIFVPLIQATLLAIHMDSELDTSESRAERVAFTTMVLPLLYNCDNEEVTREIALLLSPEVSAKPNSFLVVKLHMEAKYRCIGVECQDIGGIWDPNAKAYVEDAETCYVPPSMNEATSDGSGIDVKHVFIILVVVGIVGCIGYCLFKRRQRYLRRKRRALDVFNEEDSYSDDDDLSSIEEEEGQFT